MGCQIIQEVCKRAGERKRFPAFDLTSYFARLWLQDYPFGAGVRIRPSFLGQVTGLEYESSGGISGRREPRNWPKVAAQTVTDGNITWTAYAKTNASLIHRINSVSYDVPSGITHHELSAIDTPGAQLVAIEVSSGTAGQTYDVIAQVQATADGSSSPIVELVLRVSVE